MSTKTLTETKTLTKTQTNAINAYAGLLKAGMTYGEAMRAVAKELRGTPCATFLGELAKVHAKKYQCNYTWDGKGQAVFYNGEESTRETRNNSARVSWDRNVMVWFKPKKPAKSKTHARIAPEQRDLAMDFLANFEGDNLQAQIKQAVALLNALK